MEAKIAQAKANLLLLGFFGGSKPSRAVAAALASAIFVGMERMMCSLDLVQKYMVSSSLISDHLKLEFS